MAIFKHTQGAVSGGKRVTATDVFTQDADGVIIEVDQPAGSILEEVIVRFTNTSTHGATSSAGYEIGTSSSGNQIGLNVNGFLDSGTSIPENAVYYLNNGRSATGWTGSTLNDGAAPAVADAYTDVNRTIYLTFLHGNTTITTNSNVEVNFIFTHLN
jgi:hypothetical protein